MNPSLDSIQHLTLGKTADGQPVEVVRGADESVFLAFDSRIKRLVELHLLKRGKAMEVAEKRSALERAKQAAALRGPTFLRVLEVGEAEGVVYFTSNLADGEFIESFIGRIGPLGSTVTFALVLQLLEDLVRVQASHRLAANLRLDRVLVTALEDAFLHLKLCDYGLSQREARSGDGFGGLMTQVCGLLFLMLTGRVFGGEDTDSFPVLTKLPTGLRTTLRMALSGSDQASGSLEKLRDDVREAFSSNASALQVRNARKQLQLTEALHPQSHLQGILLEGVPLAQVLGTRFRVDQQDQSVRPAFSIPALHGKTGQSLTVHLLPPNRIIDHSQYEAVPLQSWRFKADTHPNILRSLSLWEGSDWTFLTEERLSGMPLSRLLAERLQLSPTEVLVVLKHVRAGMDQARECGVVRVDLHPSNLFLEVGKGGLNQARELERLMQRRLDAWPPFTLKLRPHLTMRSLCEPPLVEAASAESPVSDDLEGRRAFIALATFLLSGERHSADGVELPETVPEPLVAYLKDCVKKSSRLEGVPTLDVFQAKFAECLSGPSGESSLADRLRGQSVAVEEMESAGSVSDFDDEWSDDTEEGSGGYLEGASSYQVYTAAPNRSKGRGVLLMSAVLALLVVGLGYWLFSPGEDAPELDGDDAEAIVLSPPEPPVLVPTVVAAGSAHVAEQQGDQALQKVAEKEELGGEATEAKPDDSKPAATGAQIETSVLVEEGEKELIPKPLMIRKAILPSQAEIEQSRGGGSGEGESSGGDGSRKRSRSTDRLVNQFVDD